MNAHAGMRMHWVQAVDARGRKQMVARWKPVVSRVERKPVAAGHAA